MNVMLLTGCGDHLTNPFGLVHALTVEIASLQNHTDAINQSVTIRGRVIRQISLLGIFAYELQDETGHIFVLTPEPNWRVGTEITAQGALRRDRRKVGTVVIEELYVEIGS